MTQQGKENISLLWKSFLTSDDGFDDFRENAVEKICSCNIQSEREILEKFSLVHVVRVKLEIIKY